jgi:hypothetical protein
MNSVQSLLKTSVFMLEHVNAAHRLDNPKWDEAKNRPERTFVCLVTVCC